MYMMIATWEILDEGKEIKAHTCALMFFLMKLHVELFQRFKKYTDMKQVTSVEKRSNLDEKTDRIKHPELARRIKFHVIFCTVIPLL